jgi:hypothetical protein
MPAYRCWRRRPGPGPPPRSRSGSGSGSSGPAASPKRDRRASPESSGVPLPSHRGAMALTLRGCGVQTLRGVALTFSVFPVAVAVGLASRLRLRPLRLSTWTLACSSDWTPGSFALPGLFTTRGLALTLEDLARHPDRASGPVCDGLTLRLDLPSLGFASSSALPVCGIHFPEPGATPAEAAALPDSSSRGSKPASGRLRRFSRPWRFTPPHTL